MKKFIMLFSSLRRSPYLQLSGHPASVSLLYEDCLVLHVLEEEMKLLFVEVPQEDSAFADLPTL